MRIKYKRLVMDTLLLISGYLVGWTLVQYRYVPMGSNSCQRTGGPRVSGDMGAADPEPVLHKSVMIGIMTTRRHLNTRALTIHRTWANRVSGQVIFYVGDDPPTSDGQSSRQHSHPHTHYGTEYVPSEQEDDDPELVSQEELGRFENSEEDSIKEHLNEVHHKSQEFQHIKEEIFYDNLLEVHNTAHPPQSVHEEPIQLINNLPVVQLRGVSDEAYPPRDKCFAMIRHMFQNFEHQFQWFVRADDDVYIRHEELVKYLLSVDSSRPLYIGQPGEGIPTERGRLGLNPGKPYCMGGPGIVFSAPSLRLLVPHFKECASSTVTSHEDTELGRCVLQHLNISCTADLKMRKVFYQDYQKSTFSGQLTHKLPTALTLHPVKDPRVMFKLHMHFQQQRLHNLEKHAHLLEAEIKKATELASANPLSWDTDRSQPGEPQAGFTFNRHNEVRHFLLSKTSSFNRTRGRPTLNQPGSNNWQKRSLYKSQYKRKRLNLQKPAEMSETADMRYRRKTVSIELEVLTESNPVWNYAFLGKLYTINAWRNHQSRTKVMKTAIGQLLAFREKYKFNHFKPKQLKAKYQSYTLPLGLQHLIVSSHSGGYQSFLLSSRFQPLQWHEMDEEKQWNRPVGSQYNNLKTSDTERRHTKNIKRLISKSFSSRLTTSMERSSWPQLFLLLPLYGRHERYLNFLKHLESAAAGYPAPVYLQVAVYPDSLQQHVLSIQASQDYPQLTIHNLLMQGQFSRAVALSTLAKPLPSNAILVFIDVDVMVRADFLFRAAVTAKPGQAYFPIIFSTYSPLTVCYGRPNCTLPVFRFSPQSGFWRTFSFGMAALTAADMRTAGDFNLDIVGWGKEDVDFYERCLRSGVQVFRCPDPGLVHLFHDRSCDPTLPPDQLRMCKNSGYSLLGSESKLAEMILDLDF